MQTQLLLSRTSSTGICKSTPTCTHHKTQHKGTIQISSLRKKLKAINILTNSKELRDWHSDFPPKCLKFKFLISNFYKKTENQEKELRSKPNPTIHTMIPTREMRRERKAKGRPNRKPKGLHSQSSPQQQHISRCLLAWLFFFFFFFPCCFMNYRLLLVFLCS